jgi:hypothetical protein
LRDRTRSQSDTRHLCNNRAISRKSGTRPVFDDRGRGRHRILRTSSHKKDARRRIRFPARAAERCRIGRRTPAFAEYRPLGAAALEAGRAYEFRYLVDGSRWLNEEEADRTERNPYGADNSVIMT